MNVRQRIKCFKRIETYSILTLLFIDTIGALCSIVYVFNLHIIFSLLIVNILLASVQIYSHLKTERIMDDEYGPLVH